MIKMISFSFTALFTIFSAYATIDVVTNIHNNTGDDRQCSVLLDDGAFVSSRHSAGIAALMLDQFISPASIGHFAVKLIIQYPVVPFPSGKIQFKYDVFDAHTGDYQGSLVGGYDIDLGEQPIYVSHIPASLKYQINYDEALSSVVINIDCGHA